MKGKQAGHFLQNGAIYIVFQELLAFSLCDRGRMDGRTHKAIKLHTRGLNSSDIKHMLCMHGWESSQSYTREYLQKKTVPPVTRQGLNVCVCTEF